MNESVGASFFNKESEETKKKREASVSGANEESYVKSEPLKVSGEYLMTVATYAYHKEGKMVTSPKYDIASQTKSLMVVITLNVADGTPEAPKGSSIMTNIVLVPAEGADQETLDRIMNMMKPRIIALTGEKSISVTAEWFDKWLIPQFKLKEGTTDKYELVKDHQMKKQVQVKVEDDEYKGKETLKVTSIRVPDEGFKSKSNKLPEQPATTQNMQAPSSSEFAPIDMNNAVDQDQSAESSSPAPAEQPTPAATPAAVPSAVPPTPQDF
jgi:hypothetical protein